MKGGRPPTRSPFGEARTPATAPMARVLIEVAKLPPHRRAVVCNDIALEMQDLVGAVRELRMAAIAELRALGLSHSEIADLTGLPRGTTSTDIRTANPFVSPLRAVEGAELQNPGLPPVRSHPAERPAAVRAPSTDPASADDA